MNKNKIIISVRIFAYMREIVGKSIIDLELTTSSSIEDVLRLLVSKYPRLKERIFHQGKINSNLVLILNDENIRSLSHLINEGDKLAIVPPSGGGNE